MCGLLFIDQTKSDAFTIDRVKECLGKQVWRGPDALGIQTFENERFILGHNRLSILDPRETANQPMISASGRYAIIYNGEIYNHLEIRKKISHEFRTSSDTETVLEGFAQFGTGIFQEFEGMFAFIILDMYERVWVAARDRFGIKPLFWGRKSNQVVLGSEAPIIADLLKQAPNPEAIAEWEFIRRPLPGKTFFKNIYEVLPGTWMDSRGHVCRYWERQSSSLPFKQEEFEALFITEVKKHELSDVTNVALLSGGVDSSLISAYSSVSRCYTVGLSDNNEFSQAAQTARFLKKDLVKVEISADQLQANWSYLAALKGEPLFLPNEGMIYAVCRAMEPTEKVVLTGEGADELLFGYDQIFKWANIEGRFTTEDFLARYGYSDGKPPDSLLEYIEVQRAQKSILEFVEDFFLDVHLPGLLRRMDFASMAASKEARVPFVSNALFAYLYRRPFEIKIQCENSKIPLRILANRSGLSFVYERPKIGFSARVNQAQSRFQEYKEFRGIIKEALEW